MTWPEDAIDFGSPEDWHEPLVGESLSGAEIAALTQPVREKHTTGMPSSGRAPRGGDAKTPCPGSFPQEGETAAVVVGERGLEDLRADNKRIRGDMARLSSVILKVVDRMGAAERAVANRLTPFWVMSETRKTLLWFFGMSLLFIVTMCGLSVAMHMSGMKGM